MERQREIEQRLNRAVRVGWSFEAPTASRNSFPTGQSSLQDLFEGWYLHGFWRMWTSISKAGVTRVSYGDTKTTRNMKMYTNMNMDEGSPILGDLYCKLDGVASSCLTASTAIQATTALSASSNHVTLYSLFDCIGF